MQNDFNSKLIEVRKAYRFLFDFQTRIKELVSFIGGSYNFMYNGGENLFTGYHQKKGGGKLTDRAWNWLMMYYYQFDFQTREINGVQVGFAINILCDSGYYDQGNTALDKDSIEDFEDAEKSISKLIFILYSNGFWDEAWNEEDFILKNEGVIKSDEEEGGIVIFKGFELARFITEDSTKQVLQEFKDFCAQYNIHLELAERTLT